MDTTDTVGYNDLIATVDQNLRRLDRTIGFGLAFIAGILIAHSLKVNR